MRSRGVAGPPRCTLRRGCSAIQRAVNPRPGERIADLGCGTGLAGAAFRPLVRRLAGVDLSPAMVAQARAKSMGVCSTYILRPHVFAGASMRNYLINTLTFLMA